MNINRPRVPQRHWEQFSGYLTTHGWDWVMAKLSALQEPAKIEYKEKGVTAQLESKSSTRVKTLEDLIREAEIDTEVWEVEKHHINKWEVAAKKDDGTGMYLQDLWQVKAYLKRNNQVFNIKEWERAFLESASTYAPVYEKINYTQTKEAHALEIFITDHHFGKMSWREETGFDYDLKIAAERYMDAIESQISDTSNYYFEEILFVMGSDLQHTDNKNNTTTAGTPQDVDGRWQKIWNVTFECQVKAVEKLSQIAPVKVKVVPGNHDFENSFKMGFALQCWFRNNPNVEIDNSPATRKYWSYGKCLLMLAHGNNGKITEYPKVIATEMREAWGNAKYVEAHTGDKHQTKVIEDKGVRVRIIPALCPPDSWHFSNMYVGNILSTEAFIWHKEKGLKAQINYNL